MRNLSCLSLLVKYFHLCLRDISLKNPCEENVFFKVCYYIDEWCLGNVIFVWLCLLLHWWMMSGQCYFCLIVFVITFMNDVWAMLFLFDCVCYYIYEWFRVYNIKSFLFKFDFQFIIHSKDGGVYHTYCLNYTNVLTYIDKLRSREDFAEFEKVNYNFYFYINIL